MIESLNRDEEDLLWKTLRKKREQKTNNLFKNLPDEIKRHIFSFASNKIVTFAQVSKEFKNIIFDENGKFKNNFLRAAADINAWNNSMQEKAAKLFAFVFKTNCIPALVNFEAIVGKKLLIPEDFIECFNDGMFKDTLLHLAAYNNMVKAIQKLVELGINVNIRNKELCTLNIGSYCGLNGELCSALDFAACNGHIEAIIKLVELGANIKSTSTDILNFAAGNGHVKAVIKLVELGANVNIYPETGETALHSAAGNGHVKVISTLIELGSNINTLNEEKQTALDLYKEYCKKNKEDINPEIVKLLDPKS